MTKILTFETQETAQACLDAINAVAAAHWETQGFTVIDGTPKELVSKNAATGADEPGKTRTITWDTVRQNDGVYWFLALVNDPRFVDGMETLPAETYGWTETDLPQTWTEGPEDERG